MKILKKEAFVLAKRLWAEGVDEREVQRQTGVHEQTLAAWKKWVAQGEVVDVPTPRSKRQFVEVDLKPWRNEAEQTRLPSLISVQLQNGVILHGVSLTMLQDLQARGLLSVFG